MNVISWLSRPASSGLPEPTALQTLRSRQIEQLKSIDGRVVEILRDQEYQVTVDEKSGLYLKISLPSQFPQEQPIISVSPRSSHPWISDQMQVIGCQSVNSFMAHSDLGKVVREIVEEFRRNPPVIHQLPSSVQSAWSTQKSVPSSYLPHLQSFPGASCLDASQNTDQHEFSSDGFFDISPLSLQLKGLSINEIERLCNDDEKLLEMVRSLPQLQKVTSFRKILREQLAAEAKENLAKKELLEERKRLILEKYDQLNELRTRFDVSSRRQDELHEMLSFQALQDHIKVAALEAEEAADLVAEDFLDGKITVVDEFKKLFMAQRTLTHLRRVKEEKCVSPDGW